MKDNIKRLRKKRNLTQTKLAEVLGYKSPTIVVMWESGERTPPSSKLPEIAKVLGCKIDDLFS